MSLLAAVAASALSATQADAVLVTSYQSLGVDPSATAKLGEGFRAGANKPPLTALSVAQSDSTSAAASGCGEDPACLGKVGQGAGAKYVLAFGVGKAGNSLLVSALFIDAEAGKELSRASKRVLEANPDWAVVTRELSELVIKPPAEPLVVQVPVPVEVQRPHKLRTAGFVSLGIGLAFGIVATAVGLGAYNNWTHLMAATSIDERRTLAAQQVGVNLGADVCLTVGIVAAGLGLLFVLLDLRDPPPPGVFETSPVVPAPSW